MALTETGLEAVIKNLSNFESGAKTIQKAYDDIEKKAGGVERSTGSLSSKLSALGSPLASLGGQFAGLGGSILKVGAIAGGAALLGVGALTAGLVAMGTVGVKKAIDLDAQMATIAATMNTTKDAVGPLKDLILDLALDPNLTVNATEAANAIQLLAQNGVTMTQIMDGAAASTVALANATGAEFTTAATVASGVMQVFGIDAKNMGTAIDGITGVVNASKFTIDDYSQAFAQAGGIAASMGISFQDFNTVITASANNFSSGSDAGTSFKTMLQRLANPTDEAKAAMEKYGISLFDSTGKMRPLSEVAQQLNNVFQGSVSVTESVGGATKKMTAEAERAQKAIPNLTTSIAQQQAKLQLMKDELGAIIFHYGEGSLRARKQQLAIDNLTTSINQNQTKLSEYQGAISAVDSAQVQTTTSTVELTEAQKAELAAVIGGADAARSVLALSQLTSDQFNTLSGSVNDAGQAFRAAATRVDSVQGAFDIFRGIIEAIQIQISDKFLPLIREVTVWFSDLAVKFGPKVVGFFSSVASGIGSLISRAPGLLNLFGANGLAGLFASAGFTGSALFLKKISELFQLITGDAGTLGTTIQTVLGSAFTWLTTNLFPMLSQGIQFIIDHFEEFKGAMLGVGAVLGGAVFAALIAGLFSLLTPINLIIAGAALLGAAWAGNWFGIRDTVIEVIGTITSLITTFQAGGLFGSRSGSFGSEGLLAALGIPPDIITTIQNVFNQITEAFNAFMSGGIFGGTALAGGEVAVTGGLLKFLGLSDETIIATQSIISQVIAAVSQLPVWFQTNWPIIQAIALTAWQVLQSVWNGIIAGLQPLMGSLSQLGASFSGLGISWSAIGQALLTATGIVFSAIGVIIVGLISVVVGVASGVAAGIASIIETFIGMQAASTTFVTGVLQLFSGQFSEGLTNIWNGISETMRVIFTGAIKTVTSIFTGFFNSVIGFWNGFYDTLVGHSIIPDLIKKIVDLFTKTKWVDLGKNIVLGIKKGIEKNIAQVYEVIKKMVENAITSAMNLLGIQSPSQEFFDIGANISQGLAQGIASGTQAVSNALGGIIPPGLTQGAIDQLLHVQRGVAGIHEAIGSARDDVEKFLKSFIGDKAKVKLATSQLNALFHQNAEEILGATDRVAAFQAVLKRATERGGINFDFLGVDIFGGKGGGVLSVFLQAFDKRKDELEKLQLQIFQMAGRTALTIGNKLNDVIQGSADILNDRVESLQELVESGLNEVNFEGQIISATEAQRLFNEALAEQRSIQDDLLELRRNEQRLGFLEKQLNLIETIQGAGLDPAEILGGLRLGMDASIPDLIEATNRLVTAMIDQVNTDLQIGSPSKVLFKQGEFAGQGLIGGFLDQMPNLAGVIQRAISAPAMVSAPALGTASGGSVTNVYNMGNNTISNGMNEAQFAARVMQVIRGALR